MLRPDSFQVFLRENDRFLARFYTDTSKEGEEALPLIRHRREHEGKACCSGVALNSAMLEVARQVSAYCEPIEYLEGDANHLPVSDAGFDVAFCQHAIMFFPDREASVREMYRALKPGGRVAVSVFRSAEFNPAFKHLITALEKHASPAAAEFMNNGWNKERVGIE